MKKHNFLTLLIGLILFTSACSSGSGGGGITPAPSTPTTTISIAPNQIEEGNDGTTDLVFTVSTNIINESKDISFRYSTNNGTAAAGEDFIQKEGAATIKAGNTTTTVAIAIIGDTKVEANEKFSIVLSDSEGAAIDKDKNSAIGTIINDDNAAVLSINNETIQEGNDGTTDLVFTVSTNIINKNKDISFRYSTNNGTAAAGEDFIQKEGAATIKAGNTTTTVVIAIIGDTKVEANEKFSIVLSDSEGAAIDKDKNSATGTINNDDAAVLSIDNETIQEGYINSKNLEFTITSNALSDFPIIVEYSTTTADNSTIDNIATAGEDYEATSGTATIMVGQDSATISVVINNDDIDEANEIFMLNLRNPQRATLSKTSVIGRITDANSNAANISLSIRSQSISEGNTGEKNLNFIIEANTTLGYSASVRYRTENNTATSGEDFISKIGTATIPAGQDSTTIAIKIIGDTKVENNEIFDVILSNSQGAEIRDSRARGVIYNDDSAILSIEPAEINEGNSEITNLVFNVQSSAVSNYSINFSYNAMNGTANSGEDFVAKTGTAIIATGDTGTTIRIGIIGDLKVERNETFDVVLNNPQGATIDKNKASAIGTIKNDDIARIRVGDETVHKGNEVTFAITSSAIADFPISVDYSTSNDTAMAVTDYEATSGTATIPAGRDSATVSISTLNNSDGIESFNFVITNLSPSQGATIEKGTAVGTIIAPDTDVVSRILSMSDASIDEGNSGTTNLAFTISVSATSDNDIKVKYRTENSSESNPAIAGEDYEAKSGIATITAGDTTTTITIGIIGDTNVEIDEVFDIVLSNPQYASLTGNDRATGTIKNDDSATLSISDSSISEGNSGVKRITFKVTSNYNSAFPISFDYITVNGSASSATSDDDFVKKEGSATISAGSKSASIDIVIFGDTVVEADETFDVVLSNPKHAALDAQNYRATGTIDNDDLAYLSIVDATTREGYNSDVELIFTLRSSVTSVFPISVEYSTTNDTAMAGLDYIDASGTVTIPKGGEATSIAITIKSDEINESTERFFVNISNPQGATIDKNKAVGTIINTHTIELGIANSSITEGNAGIKNLTFDLTADSIATEDVRVEFETVNGSATVGEDFIAKSGIVTIPKGSDSTTIAIEIIGDTKVESDATFALNLMSIIGTPINGNNNGRASIIGTITNDDNAALTIANKSISEGNSGRKNLVFDIVSSASSDFLISLDYATMNGSATAGEDFIAQDTTTAIIIPGNTYSYIQIEIIGDTIEEADETFDINFNNIKNASLSESNTTATILNDDTAILSVADNSVIEGATGESDLVFTVRSSAIADSAITFNYTTANGTATAGEDFQSKNGNATIPAGQDSTTITIKVIGDTQVENNEIFYLDLSNPQNATFTGGNSRAVGTILTDDKTLLSIANSSITEGNSGEKALVFTVSSNINLQTSITFEYSTENNTALANVDFKLANNQEQTIQADTKEANIEIIILGDIIEEADETFNIILSNPSSAVEIVGGGRAVGTIINDDKSFSEVAIGKWTQISENNKHSVWSPRERYTSVVHEGKIWVMGGIGNAYYNDVWSSENGSDWNQVTGFAGWVARRDHSSAIFNNKMWVIGGQGNSFKRNDVWSSVDGISWVQSIDNHNPPRFWSSRSGHDSAVFNNKLWVVGGLVRSDGEDYIASEEVWSTSEGSIWGRETRDTSYQLGSKVFGHSLNVLKNNKLVVVGGQNSKNGFNKQILMSSKANDGKNWSRKYSDLTSRGHSAVVFKDNLWRLGGYHNFQRNSDVWVSNNGIGWSKVGRAPWDARVDHTSVVFNKGLYVMGGNTAGGQKNDVWRFDLQLNLHSIDVSTNNITDKRPKNTAISVKAANLTSDRINDIAVKFYYTTASSTIVLDTANHIKTVTNSLNPGEEKTFSTGNVNIPYNATYLFACIKDSLCVNSESGIDLLKWSKQSSSSPQTSLPQVKDHSSVVYDDKIWVLGGDNSRSPRSNDVWYSKNGSDWHKSNNAPWDPRKNHSSVVFNAQVSGDKKSAIWVIGGAYTTSVGTEAVANDVWHYVDGSWTRVTERAEFNSRQSHTSVVFDDRIWVLGGLGFNGRAFYSLADDIWYSRNGVNWTRVIPSGVKWGRRYSHVSVVTNNEIWVSGGLREEIGGIYGYIVEAYSDAWRTTSKGSDWTENISVEPNNNAGFLLGKNYAAAVSIDSQIFITGGRVGIDNYFETNVTAHYNGTRWRRPPEISIYPFRDSHSSVVFRDKIFVIGGAEGNHIYNDVWSAIIGQQQDD